MDVYWEMRLEYTKDLPFAAEKESGFTTDEILEGQYINGIMEQVNSEDMKQCCVLFSNSAMYTAGNI